MKKLISRGLLLAGLGAAASIVIAGCLKPDETLTTGAAASSSAEQAGSVRLSLSAAGIDVSNVTAVLSNASGESQTHDIDVSGDDGSISLFIGELPEGGDYTIRLLAGACTGVAKFSVHAEQTTLVDVEMTCPGDGDAGAPGTGSVQIVGHFPSAAGEGDAGPPAAVCDVVANVSASPSVQDGAAPSVIHLELKPGAEVQSISWVAASTTGATGTLIGLEGDADQEVAFDCSADGTAYVMANVNASGSSGHCVEHARVAVRCVGQGSSQEVRCGDGVVNQASEECDGSVPESAPAGSTCSAECKLVAPSGPRCGDGVVNQPSEECDGELLADAGPAGAACSADCKLISAPEVRCGDGVVNQTSEECDGSVPESAPAGSTCSAECKIVAGEVLGECGKCSVENCAAQRADVDSSADATGPILDCVLGKDWRAGDRAPADSCSSLDLLSCYCGGLSGQDCANAAPASLTGQCTQVILAGTGCSSSSCVAPIFLNPANANGKAMQYAQCRQDFCYDSCFNP